MSQSGKNARSGVKLSSFGFKVLKKMKLGHVFQLKDDEQYWSGKTRAPKSLMDEFLRHDLVRQNCADGIEITTAGRSLVSRLMFQETQQKLNSCQDKNVYDGGAYRAQHQAGRRQSIEGEEGEIISSLINYAESPIGRLYVKKDKNGNRLISKRQMQAAELLRQDYEYSHGQPQLTARYDSVPISGAAKGSATQELMIDFSQDCHRRYQQAITFVGKGLSDVLIRVCCHLDGVVMVEKALNWPARSGKLVLKLALDRLVDFYEEQGHL